eukprot:7692064-Prorocentrum_lima.AAC.1
MELQPLSHQGNKEDQQPEQGGESQHLEEAHSFMEASEGRAANATLQIGARKPHSRGQEQ